MHNEQRAFCLRVKQTFPEYFESGKVVDFGSLDINGSNRDLFGDVDYTGIDLGDGKGVDVVCRAHEYRSEGPVDVVISTEMLEHDEFWRESLRNALLILRKGGLLLFTCAGKGRPEHGTVRSNPDDAPFVTEYYRNLERGDIEEVFNLDVEFEDWMFDGNRRVHDLYFCGRKA